VQVRERYRKERATWEVKMPLASIQREGCAGWLGQVFSRQPFPFLDDGVSRKHFPIHPRITPVASFKQTFSSEVEHGHE
jgi:hypothetical protein